jgi:glutamate N-acetyltransferase/amino-acid N-acetyltransferase
MDYEKFKSALHYVNLNLAKQIVLDGEGAEKFLEVTVNEAKTKQDARLIAKAIIGSNLVKTAMFGADANWGRVLCAAGYSGAEFDPTKASIEFSSNAGSIITYLYGEPVVIDEEKAKKVLKEKEIKVLVSLKDGKETATAWGCDLSYEYVRINGEYRT